MSSNALSASGPAAAPATLARRLWRWFWKLALTLAVLLIGVPLGALGYGLLSGPFCHASARAQAVRVLGPLELTSFRRPPVPAEQNAELRFMQAAKKALSMGDDTSKYLSNLTRHDDPVEMRRHKDRISQILETHHAALSLVLSARRLPGCSAGLDYSRPDAELPDSLGQIRLSRLLFLQGFLALEAGDSEAVLRAIETLGRQATCLLDEASRVSVLVGTSCERRQLRLVAHVVQDRRFAKDALSRIPALLVGVDLKATHREYLRRSAAELEANHLKLSGELQDWSGKFGLLLIADHATGGGLRCAIQYLDSFDMPFARVREELGTPPRWFWGKLHWMVCSDWDVGARLRANADGRELARLAIALRLAMLNGQDCQAAWRTQQASRARTSTRPFTPRLIATRDGGCKLVHPEAAAYRIQLDDSGHPLLVWRLPVPGS